MKRKYVIDGLDEEFSSLRKAKDHFWGYSDKDKEEMNGTIITGYKGDEIVLAMNRDIELKRAIINFYCDNAKSLVSDDECKRVFKAYIYDEKGEYLIGGRSVLEFIEQARNLIYK